MLSNWTAILRLSSFVILQNNPSEKLFGNLYNRSGQIDFLFGMFIKSVYV